MSRRIVLAGIAAIFAAMLGRMGWINWPELLGCAGVVFAVLVMVVAGTAIIGLPLFLLSVVIGAGFRLAGQSKSKPPAPIPAR